MTIYIVVSGDNLWKIASKYGVALSELLTANPQISNPSLILPGQKINIPSNDTNSSNYTVKSGDTMWSIAKNQNIDLDSLIKANPQIVNPNVIIKGQNINIPTINQNNNTDTETSTNTTVSNDIRTLETEVIRLVNVERQKNGLSALKENTKINDIARLKSEDFIKNKYFSHVSQTYGTPFEMLKKYGISFTSAGENIAMGQKTAEEVMNVWMNSAGHRANILNSSYNEIGVGVAKDDNSNLYWTQMFIRS